MRPSLMYIFLMLYLNVVNTNLQGVFRQRRSICNINGTYDRALLKRVTLQSKYIFIGKVFGVKSKDDNVKIYKVNIRRVLKGDINDLGVIISFGKARSIYFTDATVLVQSTLRRKCPLLRVRTYAIFLTEKKLDEETVRLSLVVEPVLLTLRNVEIIEAAIKGKLF
ncbi:unnamed protein product [Parnassius mnemosyne]|uniref:Uncharacterized protein n=1 Tax=Parnassius mnemosyne TaxID=213953 RepID=A0AAV1M4H9_9NEOP